MRHRPKSTLLYQLVERYNSDFTAHLAEQGKCLPTKHLRKVMQIIQRAIATDIIHRAEYLKKQAKTGGK